VDTPAQPHRVRHVFEGRVFRVLVESVTLPRGDALDVEVVRHPGSVVVIPVTEQQEIILVRQYRHAIGRWAWELPAGSLKPGEDIDAAARRECHEEIGLVAETLEPLGSFYPTPGYCDEHMHFFKATGLRAPRADEHAVPDADEDIEPRPFAVATIRQLIASGEIIDLKTVGGLSLLEQR
jgi:ADP-ribose pyrophosphatase